MARRIDGDVQKLNGVMDTDAWTAVICTLVGCFLLYMAWYHSWPWGYIDGFAEVFYNPNCCVAGLP